MRARLYRQFTTLLMASGVAVSLGARAQDAAVSTASASSRAQAVADAEQEKAKHLVPQEPPRGEQKFDHIEKKIIDRLFNANGPSLKFGGLPTGGGFSLGPQYTRQDLLADHLTSNTYAVGSTKKWYGGGSSLDLHDLVNGHLELVTDGAYENAASVWYFGEGPNSSKDNKTDFRREFTTPHFAGLGHFFDQKLTVGYILGGLFAHVGPGDLSSTPTTEERFTEANTPGLVQQSNFITGTTTIQVDLSRVGFSNPEGLQLEADDSQFFDQSGHQANFHLLQTQATYYLPLTNGMRTLVFRLRNVTAFAGDNQAVPFYLQPTLGGPDDLRGYDRYRFYANGTSLATAEYRWSISQVLEMAIFGDGGNVYQRPGLIGFRNLRGDGGFGFRIKNKQLSVMRFDIGFSPEGVRVWFVFNDAFGKFSRIF
ncbi:MAG TPA: hypothetical protein VEK33_25625 [Terriglobales bacterium]|nr:hypothetical protein [Terriglobales bacterium]